ncbi:MAG: YkgJ family cysteine cluster protein [Rhodocyclaceae bacterium]|nr:YkgJ family cysteine cluster protein [Rhodocyclaceae bacterium]MBX3669370.1 YkgJ family cysteine cluster protein [Rhodocyclaceae bacterium]
MATYVESFPAAGECVRCGACCAAWRVDFHWSECASGAGGVPDGLTESVCGATVRMRGTDHASPRCAALQGTIGQSVRCAIYEFRPAPCVELQAGSDACLRARRRHGLPAGTD